jgi:hypothetical protein
MGGLGHASVLLSEDTRLCRTGTASLNRGQNPQLADNMKRKEAPAMQMRRVERGRTEQNNTSFLRAVEHASFCQGCRANA